jgi:hypothetical protein
MGRIADRYGAEVSEKVSAFEELSLVQLIVERGTAAVDALPDGIRKSREAVAETIENNVRRLIIDESPINPKALRQDVGAPRRVDRTAQTGGVGLCRIFCTDRRTDRAGEERSSRSGVSGGARHAGQAGVV